MQPKSAACERKSGRFEMQFIKSGRRNFFFCRRVIGRTRAGSGSMDFRRRFRSSHSNFSIRIVKTRIVMRENITVAVLGAILLSIIAFRISKRRESAEKQRRCGSERPWCTIF